MSITTLRRTRILRYNGDMDTYTPKPGDFFLSQIDGTGGFFIRLAQLFAGDASRYTHAGIVLDDGTVIQAQPGGATIVPLEEILVKRPLAFSDYDLDDITREFIVMAARNKEGVPYSFLDYLTLGLLALGLQPKRIRKFVHERSHMICSQLVDKVYNEAGVQLFDDGRNSGDVTPGDLAHVGTIHHVTPGPKDIATTRVYPL